MGGQMKSNRDGFMEWFGKTVKQGVLRAQLDTTCCGAWLEEGNGSCTYRYRVLYPRRQQLCGRLSRKPTPSQHDAVMRRARLDLE